MDPLPRPGTRDRKVAILPESGLHGGQLGGGIRCARCGRYADCSRRPLSASLSTPTRYAPTPWHCPSPPPPPPLRPVGREIVDEPAAFFHPTILHAEAPNRVRLEARVPPLVPRVQRDESGQEKRIHDQRGVDTRISCGQLEDIRLSYRAATRYASVARTSQATASRSAGGARARGWRVEGLE